MGSNLSNLQSWKYESLIELNFKLSNTFISRRRSTAGVHQMARPGLFDVQRRSRAAARSLLARTPPSEHSRHLHLPGLSAHVPRVGLCDQQIRSPARRLQSLGGWAAAEPALAGRAVKHSPCCAHFRLTVNGHRGWVWG